MLRNLVCIKEIRAQSYKKGTKKISALPYLQTYCFHCQDFINYTTVGRQGRAIAESYHKSCYAMKNFLLQWGVSSLRDHCYKE